MAEHDAKTPAGQNQEQDVHKHVAAIRIAHMLGGQTLIGQVHTSGVAGPTRMDRPYEIMVLPNENSQSPTVAVIKLGSMLALFPELGLPSIPLNPVNLLGLVAPTQRLIEAYMEGLKRELNPVTREEVAALIHPGKGSAE